jgi:hypothetical protein
VPTAQTTSIAIAAIIQTSIVIDWPLSRL